MIVVSGGAARYTSLHLKFTLDSLVAERGEIIVCGEIDRAGDEPIRVTRLVPAI